MTLAVQRMGRTMPTQTYGSQSHAGSVCVTVGPSSAMRSTARSWLAVTACPSLRASAVPCARVVAVTQGATDQVGVQKVHTDQTQTRRALPHERACSVYVEEALWYEEENKDEEKSRLKQTSVEDLCGHSIWCVGKLIICFSCFSDSRIYKVS